jgi:hypothetical protein
MGALVSGVPFAAERQRENVGDRRAVAQRRKYVRMRTGIDPIVPVPRIGGGPLPPIDTHQVSIGARMDI